MNESYRPSIDVIKEHLSLLKRDYQDSCFKYCIGKFILKIFPDLFDPAGGKDLLSCSFFDVGLYEKKPFSNGKVYEEMIDLEKDFRFKDYKPIKYSPWTGYSGGLNMPMTNLLELIKYLYRLDNLAAFQ